MNLYAPSRPFTPPQPRVSGNLLADRRYAYAEALLRDGDADAAADLFAQAAELAPDWAPAHLSRGLALERAGRRDDALAAFRQAAEHDRDGELGAALHAARLGGTHLSEMPAAYVATLFDQYAPRFDAHLVGTLEYRGPAIVLAALERVAPGRRFGPTLDVGCGTGLMARALEARVGPIDGVDLSSGMVAAAEATGRYRDLHVGDATAIAERLGAGSYDLVVAADVLVYLGDLVPLVRAVSRLLGRDGMFAATLQAGSLDFALGPDLRFQHGPDYVRAVLAKSGFAPASLDPCVTRREGGRDVPGLVFAARRS